MNRIVYAEIDVWEFFHFLQNVLAHKGPGQALGSASIHHYSYLEAGLGFLVNQPKDAHPENVVLNDEIGDIDGLLSIVEHIPAGIPSGIVVGNVPDQSLRIANRAVDLVERLVHPAAGAKIRGVNCLCRMGCRFGSGSGAFFWGLGISERPNGNSQKADQKSNDSKSSGHFIPPGKSPISMRHFQIILSKNRFAKTFYPEI